MCQFFLREDANIAIYDPKVTREQILLDLTEPGVVSNVDQVERRVSTHASAYEATQDADAVVILTEWDEFKTLDYNKIYAGMKKPAFIFDGRLILDRKKLASIGFEVEAIGKPRMGVAV